MNQTCLNKGSQLTDVNMVREEAEKQKRQAKEMLGISDDRAEEIFQEQPDRKQQKKKELEENGGE